MWCVKREGGEESAADMSGGGGVWPGVRCSRRGEFGERYGWDKERSMLGEVGEQVEGGVRSKSKKVHVSMELGERRGGMRRGV